MIEIEKKDLLQNNKNNTKNNNNNSMDLVKRGFEWAAVGISLFNHLIAGAAVKILFAFHLEEKRK